MNAVTAEKASDVVMKVYEAFGRRDVPAILELVADDADWEFVGSAGLAYAGNRQGRAGAASFFAAVAQLDDIQVFDIREVIEAGEHVTVLGFERTRATDTGQAFESEWVHVFTVRDGRITRWRGFFNTAARYGL